MWIASQFMMQLLVGTFGFFWLHSHVWFYREYQERKQRKTGRTSSRTLCRAMKGKHIQRFGRDRGASPTSSLR